MVVNNSSDSGSRKLELWRGDGKRGERCLQVRCGLSWGPGGGREEAVGAAGAPGRAAPRPGCMRRVAGVLDPPEISPAE